MATNKKSVLLYCDIIHTVEQLDDSDAGLLFKHYLRYINDQNPEPPSKLIQIVFEPIKQNLKRDLKKWEVKSLKNSDNAKMRWNANASERINSDANNADKDKVIDKDKFNAFAFMCDLGFNDNLVKEWFEVRKLKKLKNTETALNGFYREVQKSGKELNEVLKICVEKSWGGFKADWLDKNDNKNMPLMDLIKNVYGQQV